MGRDAFHGEGAGDPHLAAVFVGLVVQVLVLGVGGDGCVDLPLAFDAQLPPAFMQIQRLRRPLFPGVSRYLPLLPLGFESAVQLRADGLQFPLVVLVDDVDLGVVGDVAQGDVGHALVHETLPDAAVGGHFGGIPAGELGLLDLPIAAVGQDVPGVAGAHDASAGQRQGDAGGVDGNPAPAPLLGHVGGGAGAAGGVQHQVAGVSGHQDAAFYHFGVGLYHVGLVVSECARLSVGP